VLPVIVSTGPRRGQRRYFLPFLPFLPFFDFFAMVIASFLR
jgi:hypothetical protein